MLTWLTRLRWQKNAESEDPDLQRAIKRAIALVEPRLEHTSGYPSRYRDVVLRALQHAQALAPQLPGPINLHRDNYVRDPFIRAVFASPNDIPEILSLSRSLREYVRPASAPSGDLYALMGMRYRKKHIYGMETQGEMIRRDVEQEAMSFEDHTLSCIGISEAESRSMLVWDIFDRLMRVVLLRLEGLRHDQHSLGREKDQLMARLRSASAERRPSLQFELDVVQHKQHELANCTALHQLVNLFDEELKAPEAHVWLEQRKIQIDGMGILRRPEEAVLSHPLDFTDLVGMDRRRWTIVLVRYSDQELPTMSDRIASASRWLYA